MSELGDYLKLGVDLANKHGQLTEHFKNWPTDRTVYLRVCRPHREVRALIEGWLPLYVANRLHEGAVVEEPYTIYLDTSKPEYQIALNVGMTRVPTATVFVSESLFWSIAAGVESVVSAYLTAKEVTVTSVMGMELSDMAHIDKLLQMVNRSLAERNISLAAMVVR